ncbi:hypothetical protein EVAR_52704_1 [Eumeta japonica]|uniref:Uncharacterized protein n=1 Tax=Eumeta variegata TaxID=151549 RepID=A0A4C1Y3L8_EUMVA|nr:hypothetical protein EVAR_52704_1 [Eumeta japonica]
MSTENAPHPDHQIGVNLRLGYGSSYLPIPADGVRSTRDISPKGLSRTTRTDKRIKREEDRRVRGYFFLLYIRRANEQASRQRVDGHRNPSPLATPVERIAGLFKWDTVSNGGVIGTMESLLAFVPFFEDAPYIHRPFRVTSNDRRDRPRRPQAARPPREGVSIESARPPPPARPPPGDKSSRRRARRQTPPATFSHIARKCRV